jgi:aspartyl-tRNA(Asn)/glutamyl-tRNA(Gln) amidotransferase subunit B
LGIADQNVLRGKTAMIETFAVSVGDGFSHLPEQGEALIEGKPVAMRREKAIEANPKQAEDYRKGKEKLFGFFVGEVMKQTQGKANPKLVNELLRKRLKG